MRLAKIIETRDLVQIPADFRKPLALYDGSQVYHCELKRDWGVLPRHSILTTVPPGCWRTLLRVSVLLSHEPGALAHASKILATLGANILLMEGYGRDTDREGWWSAVVDFSNKVSESESDDIVAARLSDMKDALITNFDERLKEERGFAKTERTKRPGRMYAAIFTQEGSPGFEVVPNGIAMAKEVAGRRYPLLVESMRLTYLYRDLIFDGEGDLVTSRCKEHTYSDEGLKLGIDGPALLLCNTDERFLRIVDFMNQDNDLAEIRLPVRTESRIRSDGPSGIAVGIGVLDQISSHIAGGKYPINVIYTYNYITGRGKCRDESRDEFEESVIEFFLEPSANFPKEISEKRVERWKALFEELLTMQRSLGQDINKPSGEAIPHLVNPPEDARMVIWGLGEELTWIGTEGRVAIREPGELAGESGELAGESGVGGLARGSVVGELEGLARGSTIEFEQQPPLSREEKYTWLLSAVAGLGILCFVSALLLSGFTAAGGILTSLGLLCVAPLFYHLLASSRFRSKAHQRKDS